MHSISYHLVNNVRLSGPLFYGICLGFEDSDAELLNTAHGTGNVSEQALKMKQTQLRIWNQDIPSYEENPKMQF